FYAAFGDTVEPLPYHEMKTYPYSDATPYPADREHLEYLLNYNTRLLSDRVPSYSYHYPSTRKARTLGKTRNP
ncbi:MAG TPA: hypothetical protein VHM88_17435, partial [Candidatus Acidoferrales bacterium]|nr:hypothetical protein [Candidatus Acidoferrales bacterium]